MGPLLDAACDRLAYVLRRLFELALVRMRLESGNGLYSEHQSGIVTHSPPAAFQNALRRAHDRYAEFTIDRYLPCTRMV